MNTPDTEWEKSTKEIVEDFVNQCRKAETSYGLIDISYEHLRELITEALTSRDTYWKEGVNKDNLMGMIVKNSTGFDTIGNQRLWHLDIDAFEADLDTLLDNLK